MRSLSKFGMAAADSVSDVVTAAQLHAHLAKVTSYCQVDSGGVSDSAVLRVVLNCIYVSMATGKRTGSRAHVVYTTIQN